MCSKIPYLTVTGIIPETEVLSPNFFFHRNTIPEQFFVLILYLDFIPEQKDLKSCNTANPRNNIPKTTVFFRNSIPELWLDEVACSQVFPLTHPSSNQWNDSYHIYSLVFIL